MDERLPGEPEVLAKERQALLDAKERASAREPTVILVDDEKFVVVPDHSEAITRFLATILQKK